MALDCQPLHLPPPGLTLLEQRGALSGRETRALESLGRLWQSQQKNLRPSWKHTQGKPWRNGLARGSGPTGCSTESGGPPARPAGSSPCGGETLRPLYRQPSFSRGTFFRTRLHFAGGSQGGSTFPSRKRGWHGRGFPTAAPALKDAAEVVSQPPKCGSGKRRPCANFQNSRPPGPSPAERAA